MFKFFKSHSWILTCFLAIFLIPQSLTLQSKLEGRLIITGLAIDKLNDEYLITCQAVSPSSGVISGEDAAGIDFISVSAKTVREGITKIAAKTSKSPGLGHLNFIIIGSSLFDEDLTSLIDFIVRDSHTDTSVLMLVANNAKEEIIKTKDLELGSAIQLRKTFLSKHNMCNGVMTIANKFLSSKFNPSASSAISFIEIEKEQTEENQKVNPSSSSTESMSNTSNQNEQLFLKQGRIKYTLPVALFRDGRYRTTLIATDEIEGYNILNCSAKNIITGFSNLSDENGVKENLTLLSKKKTTKISVEIKENRPQIMVDVKLSGNQVLELIPEENNIENYKTQNNYLSDSIREQICVQLYQKAIITFEKAKENGVDILEAATKLRKQHKNEYDSFFKDHTLDDFISSSQIEVKIEI